MIIDAHTHISSYTGKGKTLDDVSKILHDEMKRYGVEYAIVIPDNVENDEKIANVDFALALTCKKNKFFALGSPQIIQRGTGEVTKYRKLLESGKIKGLKLYPGHDPYNPMDDRCQPYYELLEELNHPVVIHTGEVSSNPEIHNPLFYNDPKYIVEVARKFPMLNIVIAHYYWPRIDYCYNITKGVSNIYFDISGCAADEVLRASGGERKMVDVLKKTVYDRPDNVIFGTDWPLCDSIKESGFQKHIDLVKNLKVDDQVEQKIFWKNANAVYHLGI